MGQERKTKHKQPPLNPRDTSSKQINFTSSRKLKIGVYTAAGLLVVCAVVVGLIIYNQRSLEVQHINTANSLNKVASDLHSVYLDLKTKLPNVVESSFKNECSMSYSGPSTKSYSCGPSIYLYKAGAVANSLSIIEESIGIGSKFNPLYKLQTGASTMKNQNYTYSEFLFDSTSKGQVCHGYSHIYSDNVSLNIHTGKSISTANFPVESIGLYCTDDISYSLDLENTWAQ